MTFDDGGPGGRPAPTPPPRSNRPLGPALWRGWRCRCPNCGEGRLFAGYLTVVPACSVCGEAFHHHRADDLPPYLTIMVVGHVVVTGLLITDRMFVPPVWLETVIWLPVTAILGLALLRPIKGAVVALQWALAMHGFGRAATVPREEPPRPAS
ncbi:DUF983 domain-containing protein [Siculibacillus lacustris]|uniref:DUF983 domain-containing protein n=1 Tax=Siculibacillus lacustris TaxID=1549641 RepID=A0A4Q9VIZ5_9HYPH|nr:DUF983 domain-containing protein [Siculibacillus lacustris]